MNLTEFQELVRLLNEVRDKMAYLAKLFPAPGVLSQKVDFEPAQRGALKDIDDSWARFKQRAKALGAWVDEEQGQFRV